jgi:hypothetical protein
MYERAQAISNVASHKLDCVILSMSKCMLTRCRALRVRKYACHMSASISLLIARARALTSGISSSVCFASDCLG